MAGIQSGANSALQALIDRYWQPLVGYASRFLDSKDAAEDIAQDAFVRLWERRLAFDLTGSVRCYLYRTVRNRICDEQRKTRVRTRWLTLSPDPEFSPSSDPAQIVEAKELRRIVERKISSLPTRRREVFILAHLHDLTYHQVAEVMGISAQTVANHVSTALTQLRGELAAYLGDQRAPLSTSEASPSSVRTRSEQIPQGD
jgi:RNA polymerase sigma-70 factor (ECF subfamily)